MSSTAQRSARANASRRSLVPLLGEARATIVEHLRRNEEASVAELAQLLDISEVATRRHLAVLTADGLVDARTVAQRRGRPASRYRLTGAAAQLFPQGYDRLASEMLDFLTDELGRDGLRAFLRWRLDREVGGLRDAVTAEDLHERLEQLARALSEAGFDASVSADGDRFTLRQDHCAIEEVAREHPEICAYEAATFAQVLGPTVKLSRRETLAGGADACVCCITAVDRDGAGDAADDDTAGSAGTTTRTSRPRSRPGQGDER